MNKTEQKKQWHMGFYGAIELEFREDKDKLDFLREYQLSKKPLSMDVLIVKKKGNGVLHNNIGRIFRTHNVVEYKSPDDKLGIDQFYKGLSYAYLYKSLGEHADERKIEDMSLSFVREGYPRELFKKLRKQGYGITEQYPGIHYITNNLMMPVQIIVAKGLGPEEHLYLKALSDKVNEQTARKVVEHASLMDEGSVK